MFSDFDLPLLVGFIIATVISSLTPGPAVLKVMSDSMSNSLKLAHAGITAIFLVNLIYAILAAFGLHALLKAFPVLFDFIKWAGVIYLLYLASGSLYSALHSKTGNIEKRTPTSFYNLFWSGFLMQAMNPKSFLFFFSILPGFAAQGESAGQGDGVIVRMLILALLTVVIEYPILFCYAWVARRFSALAITARSQSYIHIASGGALLAAAFLIARTSLTINEIP